MRFTITTILFFSLGLSAQDYIIKNTDNVSILEDLRTSRFEEDLEQALAETEKIASYDTLYEDILLDKSVILIDLERYDEALTVCKEGLSLNGSNTEIFYQNMGVAYAEQEMHEEALAVYMKAESEFPRMLDIQNNILVTLRDLDRHRDGLERLKDLVPEYPFFPRGHLQASMLGLQDNEMSRALMSMTMAILVEDNRDRGNSVLGLLESISGSKHDSVPLNIFENEGDDYSKIDLLLKNKVAMDKKYKTDIKVDLDFIRQMHLLCSLLADGVQTGEGFWNDFYVDFYKECWRNQHFDGMVYFMLQFSSSDMHQRLVQKNMRDVKAYLLWRDKYIQDNWMKQGDTSDGLRAYRTFYDGGGIQREGFLDSNDKAEGEWHYYSDSGRLETIGSWKNGERHGHWTWFDGLERKSSEIDYSDGQAQGEYRSYYSTGQLKESTTYDKDEMHGPSKSYYASGALKEEKEFVHDKVEGLSLEYYPHGVLSDSTYWKEGKVDHIYYGFHPNGRISVITEAKEGQAHGTKKEFDALGNLMSEYSYVDGDRNGTCKDYFADGSLSYEFEYKDDKVVGTSRSYYRDGGLDFETNYDEEGKQNGTRTTYDRQGNIHEIRDFSKGNMTGFRFLDDEGNTIVQGKKKGKDFDYEGLYFDGTLRSKGLYNVKGGQEGLWRFYDVNGALSSEENYEDGLSQGPQKTYFANGKLNAEYTKDDGQTDGPYTSYYSHGDDVQTYAEYDGGLIQGVYSEYWPDGSLSQLNYYINGVIDYTSDYEVDGSLEVESFYTNGELDSVRHYGPDGQYLHSFLLQESNGPLAYKNEKGEATTSGMLLDGKRHGPFRFGIFKDRCSSEGNYLLGEEDGPWTYYHSNGEKSSTYVYVIGQRHGPYQSWDWFGNLRSEGEYRFGELSGEYNAYYPDGAVMTKSNYVAGQYHGERRFYAPNGELQMIRYYDHGVLTSYSYLGKDKKPVSPINIDRSGDELISYYPNGQIARSYKIKNGLIYDELKEYQSDGTLTQYSEMLDDEVHGLEKHFDKNGNIWKESTYWYGYRHGPSKVYWPNGQLRLETEYRYGMKHGVAQEYDQNGKLIAKYTFNDNVLFDENRM